MATRSPFEIAQEQARQRVQQTVFQRLGQFTNNIKQGVQNWQAQNRQAIQKVQVPDFANSFVQGTNSGALGFTGLDKKIPIGYQYKPQTNAGKVAQFAGGAVGYGLGAGKLLGPVEKAVQGALVIPKLAKTAPIASRAVNLIARKTAPAILSESASAIPTSFIKSRIDNTSFANEYAGNLAGGLAGRAVGKGIDVASPYVGKAGKAVVNSSKSAVQDTRKNILESALNKGLEIERGLVNSDGTQIRNQGKYGSKVKLQRAIGSGDVMNKEIPLFRVKLPGKELELKLSPSKFLENPELTRYIKGPANDSASILYSQSRSGGFIKTDEFLPKKGNNQDLYRLQEQKLSGKNQLPMEESIGISRDISSKELDSLSNQKPVSQLTENKLLTKEMQTGKESLQPEMGQASRLNSSLERIIQDGQKEIGTLKEDNLPLKQKVSESWDRFYTDWVDRYHPLMKATQKVEQLGKKQGFELRPENNPRFAVRRFLGMGGIAEQRFESELKPVLDQVDQLGVSRADLDVYLKSKRDINLASRGVKGSDAQVATDRINAINQKYGKDLDQIAQQMYDYQAKGFNELVEAGFISREQAGKIQDLNKNYVPFQRVMDEVDEYLGVPTKKAMQGKSPLNKIKGSDKQIYSPVESIIANTFKQRSAIEKNNVARSVADLANIMPEIGFKKVNKSGVDTITVWRNGQKEYVQVGQEIADAMKGMNEEQMNNVLKLFTGPASILRQGATGRNPEFMLPNFFRDQQDAAINSKYGYVPVVDYVKGFASVFKNDDLYNEWKASGGTQSFSSLSGRKAISQMIDEKESKRRLFNWVGKGLDLMGKYSEEPTRVGLYKRAKEATGNKTLAMMESREGTMDFSRMGAKMKVANSMIPFLNVGVQGFDKLARNAKENPAGFALKLAMVSVLPQVTTTAYNLKFHPEEYMEIPQYEKDGNFVFVKGRNEDGTIDYITIPKGNIAQVGANPVDQFMTFVAGKNSQSVGEFATQFLSSTLPLLSEGQSLKEVAVKSIGSNLPQAVKPITENLLNKSFYKYNPEKEQSKEIVPSYLQKKAPGDQSYEWTPSAYKVAGKVLNVSPLQIQNVAEGYLAGYAKIPVQLVDTLKGVSEGKAVDPNQKTILRRFIKQTYPESTSKKTVQEKETPLLGQASASELPATALSRQFSGNGNLQELEKKHLTLDDERRKEIKNLDDKSELSDSELVSYYFGKEINLPKSNTYEYAIRKSKLLGKVDDIEKSESMSDEQKTRVKGVLLKKLGVTPQDYEMYSVAKQGTNEKTLYVLDQLGKVEDKDLYSKLSELRKPYNGQKILSDGVIDNLVNEGQISQDQGKKLKKIDFTTSGVLKAATSKKAKIKKIKIPKVKLPKLKKIKIRKTKLRKINV